LLCRAERACLLCGARLQNPTSKKKRGTAARQTDGVGVEVLERVEREISKRGNTSKYKRSIAFLYVPKNPASSVTHAKKRRAAGIAHRAIAKKATR
jgi:hypothetical protein